MTTTRPQRILIGDDNPIVRKTLSQSLRAEGREVITAETGTRAFLVLRDFSQAIDRQYARAALPGLIDGWILADIYQDRHADRSVILAGAKAGLSSQGDIVLDQPKTRAVFNALRQAFAFEKAPAFAAEPSDAREQAARGQDARERAIDAALAPPAAVDAPDSTASIPSAPERRVDHAHRSEKLPLTGRAAAKAHRSWPPARLMRGGLGTLARLSQVAALLGLAAAPAQSAPLSQFDGRWSVLVVTDRGDCSIYRYGVIVDHGRARYAGTADFTINGSIAPNGTVRASISRGGNRADVQGRLGQGTGYGLWRTAASDDCSGHWTAERRAASEEE
jgi:CheY-like chemotaxis protein